MHLRYTLAAVPLLATSVLAHADDLYTLTGGGNTITFTLPTNPTSTVDSHGINLGLVSVDANGAMTTEDLGFYNATYGGGLVLSSGTGTLVVDALGPQLFGGTDAMPTFGPGGPYSLPVYNSLGIPVYNNDFTLEVTPVDTPPATAPEPSSVTLLGRACSA